MTDSRALVIQNSPSDPVRRLGDWLQDAGLELNVVKPHAGDQVPDTLEGHAALVVLGGPQSSYGAPDGAGAPWFAAERRLMRSAVEARVPTLAICLGAQLLAEAYGGRVAPAQAGPEIGPRLVARRDVAGADPLFAEVPFTPDVMQWHFDEIVELPAGATLLAASPEYPHQAFRVGARAWALQFHIECDEELVTAWARKDGPRLSELDPDAGVGLIGRDPEELAQVCRAALDDMVAVWRPFAERFAALARGRLDLDAAQDPMRRLAILGE
ncbi:MAG: type 1 glutamine amidotransferase [Micromonosporaceae bacterium]